jgi:hypothetical protein
MPYRAILFAILTHKIYKNKIFKNENYCVAKFLDEFTMLDFKLVAKISHYAIILDLGSSVFSDMGVQIPSSAPINNRKCHTFAILLFGRYGNLFFCAII